MSDNAVPDDIARALGASDRHAYLEQRLFVLSPFGTLPTTIILFAAFAGSFAIAWVISGRPFLVVSDGRLHAGILIWLAFWFSLMLTTALGMQRYSRVKDREDIARYAAVLRGGWPSAATMTELTPTRAPLRRANLIGLAVGLVASVLLYATGGSQNLLAYPALLIWFAVATTGLIMTFTRGVALTRSGARNMRRIIDQELLIDLLRIDRLSVIGRSAARPSLVWFTVSAVIFLLFIEGGLTIFTVTLLLACAAMGLWVFVATMEQVHRKILRVKAAELERLRGEIDAVQVRCAGDADCAVKLQGLLAYEARIAAAPEWPFDQTTAVRVGASVLILTVPWFGQAVAAYVVEHAGHITG
ncbi:MAG: hypothetical protein WDM91_16135 [Rhizomicrobium sp.]